MQTLLHVNEPHVHLVACVRVLGHVLDMFFIHSLISHTMPGVLVLLSLILHLHAVGVANIRGEVDQGVLFVIGAAPEHVVATDVDKILAGQARNIERFLIVGGVHCNETVVGAVDKPGETLAGPCGQVVVVGRGRHVTHTTRQRQPSDLAQHDSWGTRGRRRPLGTCLSK